MKTGVLVENILVFSHKTIIYANYSSKHSHQSSLCPSYGHSFGVICLHILYILKTILKYLIKTLEGVQPNIEDSWKWEHTSREIIIRLAKLGSCFSANWILLLACLPSKLACLSSFSNSFRPSCYYNKKPDNSH